MVLNKSTKVSELIQTHPFLLDYLVEYHPEFKKLKNPIVRKTMGRLATLEMAAGLANIDPDQLVADLTQEIQLHYPGKPPSTALKLTVKSNNDPQKIKTLKQIILALHNGEEFETVKKNFMDFAVDISAGEIAQMEQQLIAEGLPQSEVKRLCDVHVDVFKSSLETQETPQTPPGHPIHTFMLENQAILGLTGQLQQLLELRGLNEIPDLEFQAKVAGLLKKLDTIKRHYARKEYQLFPFLEQKDFSGPSQVMWEIHDDIRADLRSIQSDFESSELIPRLASLVQSIEDMVYKEEHILFPVSLELLTTREWLEIRDGSSEIGYTLIEPALGWKPEVDLVQQEDQSAGNHLARIPLDTGLLSHEQLNLMLTHLPVELSFVDENDEVRYYSQVPEKIFQRSPGVIGRKVQNCHPPKSVHQVNAILKSFKAGEKDVAEFWIPMGERFIHIRYFAVRDHQGKYRGTLEVVQDVAEIRKLSGERRLLDWE